MEKSRGHLTRRKIAEAGIVLLDETGMGGLSMRKLGGRLGVEAMSLYNHVKNKNDLLDAIHGCLLEGMMEELARRPPVQGWDTAARSITLAFLQLLRAHPNAIPLFASRSAIAPGALSLLDGGIGVLRSAGFSAPDARNAFQTLFALTLGHAVFHYGRRSEQSYANPDDYARHENLALVGNPNLHPPDVEFDFGLDTVIEGLRKKLGT